MAMFFLESFVSVYYLLFVKTLRIAKFSVIGRRDCNVLRKARKDRNRMYEGSSKAGGCARASLTYYYLAAVLVDQNYKDFIKDRKNKENFQPFPRLVDQFL